MSNASIRFDGVGHDLVKTKFKKPCACCKAAVITFFKCQKCDVHLHPKHQDRFHAIPTGTVVPDAKKPTNDSNKNAYTNKPSAPPPEPYDYLPKFIEKTKRVPLEIRALFDEMRVLDDRCNEEEQELQTWSTTYLKKYRALDRQRHRTARKRAERKAKIKDPSEYLSSSDEDSIADNPEIVEALDNVYSLKSSCTQLSNKKCDLAEKGVKYIDDMIGRLDIDLRFFGEQVNREIEELEKKKQDEAKRKRKKKRKPRLTLSKRRNRKLEAAHIDELPPVCPVCQKHFTEPSKLTQHLKDNHTDGRFCDVCQISISMDASMLKHLRAHSGEKPYKCTKCLFRTDLTSNLAKHIEMVHSKARLKRRLPSDSYHDYPTSSVPPSPSSSSFHSHSPPSLAMSKLNNIRGRVVSGIASSPSSRNHFRKPDSGPYTISRTYTKKLHLQCNYIPLQSPSPRRRSHKSKRRKRDVTFRLNKTVVFRLPKSDTPPICAGSSPSPVHRSPKLRLRRLRTVVGTPTS